ncbi:MAG: DUF5691 domain-containing protein [Ferruginibacter sp.]
MEIWNNIIQAAMLGTDKRQVVAGEFTEDFTEVMAAVTNNQSIDKEEKFLQASAIVFNYRQCGSLPVYKEGIDLPEAPVEEFPVCRQAATNILNDILNEDSLSLLTIWLQFCGKNNQLVTPRLVPVLLNKAEKQKALQGLVEKCCGRRGEWLAQFNANWSFSSGTSADELWQTGTPDQRKQVLQQLRITDPGTAREWLQQTWPQENANSKAALLKALSINAGNDDIAWLETVATEKAQKVKDEALNILKLIPASAVVQKYKNLLRETVTLKKEKAMFGLTTKTSLQIQLPAVIDEEIYKTGIEKLSNQKEIPDEEFIVSQLMRSVPPDSWESLFTANPETIINYFQQQESTKKFLAAIVISVVRFQDKRWAVAFMQYSKIFYIDIIPLLPLQQQEFYSNKFFGGYENSIINHAIERKEEWGVELTRNIFRFTADNPYQYNRSFYNKYIHLVPVQIIGELEKCKPANDYDKSVWSNTSEYITKLITLKIQTIKAFQ